MTENRDTAIPDRRIAQWQKELRDLERRLTAAEEANQLRNEILLHQAVQESQKEFLRMLGVNIDDPAAVQDFQQAILLARNVRSGVNKSIGGVFLAFCGAIGAWLLLLIQEYIKRVSS